MAHSINTKHLLLLNTADEHTVLWLNICGQSTVEADSATHMLLGSVMVSIWLLWGNATEGTELHSESLLDSVWH